VERGGSAELAGYLRMKRMRMRKRAGEAVVGDCNRDRERGRSLRGWYGRGSGEIPSF